MRRIRAIGIIRSTGLRRIDAEDSTLPEMNRMKSDSSSIYGIGRIAERVWQSAAPLPILLTEPLTASAGLVCCG